MLTPKIDTSEAHAVATLAGLFLVEMGGGELWRFSSSSACYIRQGDPEALLYPDATFTTTHASEIFNLATHGLLTGDGPFQLSNVGGALPAGVTALTDYWVIRIDAGTFYLATSLALALAGTNLAISGNGTGTHTISDTADTERVDGFLAAAATGSMYLAAGESIILEPGLDQGDGSFERGSRLSVIRSSADGVATLTEMAERADTV